MNVRIVLVDDQEAFRIGMKALLSTIPGMLVIGEAGNGRDALTVAVRERPDIVLMDLRMPIVDGIAATRAIRSRLPAVKVLVLTTFDDAELVHQAILAGAAGYLLKAAPAEDIGAVIRLTLQGYASFAPGIVHQHTVPSWFEDVPRDAMSGLTARERDVLRELARGATNKEVAERLTLTEGTVRNYVTRILNALALRSRTEAALFARSQFDRTDLP
jgi:DNA-binding NarL/FixJ family response regulator